MTIALRDRLISLGLRSEGEFVLHSGARSDVFWDIEGLFRYPQPRRAMAIREFINLISDLVPDMLIGVPTGGWLLAQDISKALNLNLVCDHWPTLIGYKPSRVVVIDDVLTTGNTVKRMIHSSVIAIAVLINRNGMLELDGIPVVSGVITDIVEACSARNVK